jgi:tRNA A-37 threonylcarbamoyl transferase component Bud32
MPKPIESEFNALRTRARQKRDLAIAQIRSEYEAQLVQIAALEQSLLGKQSARHKKISAAVESVIPRDRQFNTQDIMTALEAMEPTRYWRKRSVDFVLTNLRRKGLIRRLKRATIHERASYIRAEVPVADPPMGDMTLLEAIGRVHQRPMTSTEICVALLEAGYQTTMNRNNLRNHVTRVMGRGRFKCEGGRWVP